MSKLELLNDDTPITPEQAERCCRDQRLGFARRWLRANINGLDDRERLVCERVIESIKGDGEAYDRALVHPEVNDLFARGVLYFEASA